MKAGIRAGVVVHLCCVAAIQLFSWTTTLAGSPETRNAGGAGQQDAELDRSSDPFAYPVSTAKRRFIDQHGKIYLLKTMSSWAMSQNCSDSEITQALEGLKALRFNAVTVSPFGVHMNDSFGDRYRNKAGQSFFSGKPYASSLGPAWSSMDWVTREATRMEMTVVFSFFMSG